MSCERKLFKAPGLREHFVQFYDSDKTALTRNVACYISEGLKHNEGALVIATAEHRHKLVLQLRESGADPEKAIDESRLLLLDAERTLGEFMIDREPDWRRFEAVFTATLGKLEGSEHTGLRAYGEMVGLLWAAGQYTAAIRLEEFWNRLLSSHGFALFCAYPIDIFDNEFRISGVDALLCDHTRLISTGSDESIERAIYRAMDERLGEQHAEAVRLRMKVAHRPCWAALPNAEGAILWLRKNLPNDAEAILRDARQYYRASTLTAAAV